MTAFPEVDTVATQSPLREPFWFGVEGRRCFGVLHRPAVPSGRGIVICRPVGFEGLIAHRALFHLAQRLAGNGDLVLRFDYHGTGDADGGDWEPARVDAWLDSIHQAVELLRTGEGISEIYLVGLRMGATLASLYADDDPDVAGLVLWSPCVDGRAYVRELLALSRLAAGARPPQGASDRFPQDSLEVAGFEFTNSTLDAIGRISLIDGIRRTPPPAVLVVDHPDGGAPAQTLAGRLEELGTTVDYARIAGYGAFMVDDETHSVLPVEVLDRIEAWFDRRDASVGPVFAPDSRPAVSQNLVVTEPAAGHLLAPSPAGCSVVEAVTQVSGQLFGIVSEPLDRPARRRVAVILLNTGSTNRTGQGRLSVVLARYWASLGFTVVRLDLGGIGDSRAGEADLCNTPYAEDRIREVIEAVGWARRELDIDHVVLYGLCSGAYQSFHAALQGAEIDRAILVNPAIFYLLAHRKSGVEIKLASNARRAATSRKRWKKALGDRRGTMLSVRRAGRGCVHLAKAWCRAKLRRMGLQVREPLELAADLTRVAALGVDLVVVFARAEPGENYLRTFGGDTLRRLEEQGHVRVEAINGGDHTFSPPAARQQMIESVSSYLQQSYPVVEPVGA